MTLFFDGGGHTAPSNGRGGRIVVAEPDWGTLLIDFDDQHMTNSVLPLEAEARHGGIGRRLPRLLRDAGLMDLQVVPFAVLFLTFELAVQVCELRAWASRAAERGYVSREQWTCGCPGWMRRVGLEDSSQHSAGLSLRRNETGRFGGMSRTFPEGSDRWLDTFRMQGGEYSGKFPRRKGNFDDRCTRLAREDWRACAVDQHDSRARVVRHDSGGVTCHVSRMYVPQPSISSAADAETFIQNVRAATDVAIRDVVILEPDFLIHGFTGLSFIGGLAENQRLKEHMEACAGLPVTTGAEAVIAAVRACRARNVAIVTPQPEMLTSTITNSLQSRGCICVGYNASSVRQHWILRGWTKLRYAGPWSR